MNLDFLETLKQNMKSAWERRIVTEIDYGIELDKVCGGKFSALLDKSLELLQRQYLSEGHLCDRVCVEAEKIIEPLGFVAKKQTVLMVAHAHIDINWLWGLDETVSITTATIETMLSLLKSYPNFTFSQSQAFVYKILEQYRPDLLQSVKKYIKDGRFEVTASTFVEADKNLSSGESQVQQLIHAKKYLSNLLNIPIEDLNLDFEPDTFGHTENVPEILAAAGVKYYYHCRGNNLPPIYRWRSASGKSVLVYREPQWYLCPIEYDSFRHVPDFSHRYGTDTLLKVYGVGDHGGGPTVRDIERIQEIADYPVMATIRFGTYREFFRELEKCPNIPTYSGNQSSIFGGCYTSMSEIKDGNDKAERMFYDLNTASFMSKTVLKENRFVTALEKLQVNQFHDILPGSGIEATRTYALGSYQEIYATFGSYQTEMFEKLVSEIDTSELVQLNTYEEFKENRSFGAGVGYTTDKGNFAAQIAYGDERLFAVINTLSTPQNKIATVMLWDYYGNVENLEVVTSRGESLPFVITDKNPQFYWYHNCHELKVAIPVSGFGYETIIVRPRKNMPKNITYPPLFERTEDIPENITLENDLVKAVFASESFRLISFIRKSDGQELLRGPAEFELAEEDNEKYMTAWVMGRLKHCHSLHENVKIVRNSLIKNEVEEAFSFQTAFGNSKLTVKISLPKNSSALCFEGECEFLERGSEERGVPQLRFVVPVADNTDAIYGDVAMGLSRFERCNRDIACHSFIANEELELIGRAKHGFRFYEGKMSVTLLRASYDPHPNPEYGLRKFNIFLGLTGGNAAAQIHLSESLLQSYIIMPLSRQGGTRPASDSLLEISPNLVVSNICQSNPSEISLRVYNPEAKSITGFIVGSSSYNISRTDLFGRGSSKQKSSFRYDFDLKPGELATYMIEEI